MANKMGIDAGSANLSLIRQQQEADLIKERMGKGEVICPVLGGLEQLGRDNVSKLGGRKVEDLDPETRKRLVAEGVIDEKGRIRGLVADAEGNVSYKQLYDSFARDLNMSPGLFGVALGTAATGMIGDHGLANMIRGPEVMMRYIAGERLGLEKFGLEGLKFNVFKLPEGGVKHNYDSLILTEPQGKEGAKTGTRRYDEAAMKELLKYAETAPDGTKVMTWEAFDKAIDARYDRDAGNRGTATKGIIFAKVEARGIYRAFGKDHGGLFGITEAEMRSLYRDKKLPDTGSRPPVSVSTMGVDVIKDTVTSAPAALGEDIRRMFSAVVAAVKSPFTNAGRGIHGAQMSLGEKSATDNASVAGGAAGRVVNCPYLSGIQSSMPAENELKQTHTNLITTA